MKSLKNIVHSLISKKPKSSRHKSKDTQRNSSPESLDKESRHCRSADDLADDAGSDCYSDNFQNFRSVNLEKNRSRSLPRRSQSCNNMKSSTSSRHSHRHSRKAVGAHHENSQVSRKGNAEEHDRDFMENINHSESYFPKASEIPSRTSSHQERISEFHDSNIYRTTSWSHPQHDFRRANSGKDDGSKSRSPNLHHTQESDNIPQSRSSVKVKNRETTLGQPTQIRRSSSGIPLSSSKQETEQKLKTCLTVLDRLCAQVKEIKDVSKRVGYVDTKLRNGSIGKGEIEKQLRELDIAAAESQRIKDLVKKGVDDTASNSSGYSSENGFGKIEHRDHHQLQSRPFGRSSHYDPSSLPYRGGMMPYPSHPYPQSASDMMSIWDAKELAARGHYPSSLRVAREDSASSGYATGGSEDGRQESPNAADVDSITSLYSMQGGCHHPQSKQALTLAWKNQHFNHVHHPGYNNGYGHGCYDPYAIYASQSESMRGDGEAIYGTYGEIYGYAPSSTCEEELFNNGWYQLRSTNPPAPYGVENVSSNTNAYNSGNDCWRYVDYAQHQTSSKYGGLTDLFYDPTAQSNATLMESIAKEVATSSHNVKDTSFKSYGSYRYRNGQRTVTTPATRGRKTVRFSQTVRQRVETEESEMEDSTSTIKGCAEDNEESSDKEVVENGIAQDASEGSAEIYMWPTGHNAVPRGINFSHAQAHTLDNHNQQQNTHPEPIYEFPSGHIESSCMCNDCILARESCQMRPTQAVSYF